VLNGFSGTGDDLGDACGLGCVVDSEVCNVGGEGYLLVGVDA